ncbi:SMG8 [Brachionus plicatilis]|uniref:Nonsense-mediated mRNA decay factor SMG8 n=1 Tax=Brachionus plicatilis TaxID=10195 RepID=A0A3M7PWF5_BRAPC|nr:SMG8 [Brachionus plicatilis]
MSNEPNICVVSLIGKSQFSQNDTKAWKLNSLLQKNVFKHDSSLSEKSVKNLNLQECDQSGSKPDNFHLKTHLDQKNRVMYIHFESIYDSGHLFDVLVNKFDEETDFYELWEDEQLKYVKTILFLFSISHLIIISNPTCEFDISYIRLFRIVDLLRSKIQPSVVELLKSLDLSINKDWIYAGRPCSPRVLFTFENCQPNILKSSQSIEKLQHSLEDQIYNSLRKSYVITNISNNSLFSIPVNQEFVYIHRHNHQITNASRFLLSSFNNHSVETTSPSVDLEQFRKFIFQHVQTALSVGFNDNIGRTNIPPIFELTTPTIWNKIYQSLFEFFLCEPKTQKVMSIYAQLKDQIDIDVQFSERRCKKVLPQAINLYQESLPAHYSKDQHEQKLQLAIDYFQLNARGPKYNLYLDQLKSKCDEIWQNGRRLCESVSLTGQNCVHELHYLMNEGRAEDELEESEQTRTEKSNRIEENTLLLNQKAKNYKIPTKTHSSGILTISASNCGEFQRERKDPFDLKEANLDFYKEFEGVELIKNKMVKKYIFKHAEESEFIYPMIHSECPLNSKSEFDSWSLVSIGEYSDYYPSSGLSQPGFMTSHNFLIPWELHVCNGQVSSLCSKQWSKKNSEKSKSKNSVELLEKKGKTVTIKAYIGLEYECPLGHRFICSGPDRIVRLFNNGSVKDDAYKLLNCDMPLYTACPCRNTKESPSYMAQAMRVFIVTPPGLVAEKGDDKKTTTVNICIKPQVQPNPQPCPVFWPSFEDSIVLEDNSIWVLRLPYIYMGDDQKPYYRPKNFETLNSCKILKSMFSVVANN